MRYASVANVRPLQGVVTTLQTMGSHPRMLQQEARHRTKRLRLRNGHHRQGGPVVLRLQAYKNNEAGVQKINSASLKRDLTR